MRISDWSSDVCSSDLFAVDHGAEVQVLEDVARVDVNVGTIDEAPQAGLAVDVGCQQVRCDGEFPVVCRLGWRADRESRSEEHTSELQSLMRISYAVFCLKKKRK